MSITIALLAMNPVTRSTSICRRAVRREITGRGKEPIAAEAMQPSLHDGRWKTLQGGRGKQREPPRLLHKAFHI
ncbi:MAG: hypothetical protein QM579_04040 [Desulfovibrio sp.]|uniref:hypothetical protein n=1 Tax=Desulfovibrio sp. TaxID=885 RepID=UPI0039E5D5D2